MNKTAIAKLVDKIVGWLGVHTPTIFFCGSLTILIVGGLFGWYTGNVDYYMVSLLGFFLFMFSLFPGLIFCTIWYEVRLNQRRKAMSAEDTAWEAFQSAAKSFGNTLHVTNVGIGGPHIPTARFIVKDKTYTLALQEEGR